MMCVYHHTHTRTHTTRLPVQRKTVSLSPLSLSYRVLPGHRAERFVSGDGGEHAKVTAETMARVAALKVGHLDEARRATEYGRLPAQVCMRCVACVVCLWCGCCVSECVVMEIRCWEVVMETWPVLGGGYGDLAGAGMWSQDDENGFIHPPCPPCPPCPPPRRLSPPVHPYLSSMAPSARSTSWGGFRPHWRIAVSRLLHGTPWPTSGSSHPYIAQSWFRPRMSCGVEG